jgi:ABC-type amino acid transport substrate-binding protein
MKFVMQKHCGVLTALLALSGALAACEDLFDPERDPDEVPLSEAIELSRTGGDLPLIANGRTQDTLVARIPRGASARVVTFTTSAGTFALKPGGTEIKVRAERSGDPRDDRLVARAVLVADTIARTAVVSASVGEFTDYLQVPFVK